MVALFNKELSTLLEMFVSTNECLDNSQLSNSNLSLYPARESSFGGPKCLKINC